MSTFPFVAVLDLLAPALAEYPVPLIDQMGRSNPFQVLIATILSLRTRDETTAHVTPGLFAVLQNAAVGATLDPEAVATLIYPVGFYRTKAKSIVEICKILTAQYNGNVPNTLEELLALPGVGRKTANLVLSVGYGIPAICVDIHVHRICNRWQFVDTETPEQTEFALRQTVPSDAWIAINQRLVTLGQHICKPVSPLCTTCPIQHLCPRHGVGRHR
jgi:endonuclease-3